MAPGGAVGARGGCDVISTGPFQVPESSERGGRHGAWVCVAVGGWGAGCEKPLQMEMLGSRMLTTDVAEDGKSTGHHHPFTKQPLHRLRVGFLCMVCAPSSWREGPSHPEAYIPLGVFFPVGRSKGPFRLGNPQTFRQWNEPEAALTWTGTSVRPLLDGAGLSQGVSLALLQPLRPIQSEQ